MQSDTSPSEKIKKRHLFIRRLYQCIEGLGILAIIIGLVQFLEPLWNRLTVPADLALPKYSTQEITAWTEKSAQEAMTFDYVNIDQRLEQSRAYFTEAGWKGFSRALKESLTIDATKDKRLHVSLKVEAPPEIENSKSQHGVYTWYIKAPVVLDFDSSDIHPLRTNLYVKIERVPLTEKADGIGIAQWVTSSTNPFIP